MCKRNLFLLIAIVGFLASCGKFFNTDKEEKPLARVGDAYLYSEDVASLIRDDMSAQDSTFFVTNYINTWATNQLLLTKAKINLSEEQQREYNRLIDNYRAELYTRGYMEALVQQSEDTTISNIQLNQYYEAEKDNFKLSEKLVQLRFVELPQQFLNRSEVTDRIKDFEVDDKRYLDSISVQFKKLHFNDTVWVSVSRLMEEIRPLDYDNVDKHLKKSQFFELTDSLGIYLGKVTGVLNKGDIAPLVYIRPQIEQIMLNRRKLDYIKALELDILDEAIQTNEFEIYEKE